MYQGRILPRSAQILAAGLLAVVVSEVRGQTGVAGAPARRAAQTWDGPNAANDADMAAGEFVDSLFSSFAPADPLSGAATRAIGLDTPTAARRPQWSARLVHNPNPEDGNPPFVLIDRYGGIQRYIEPVPQIDLERYVGQTVAVRRDTGGTLLASQLALPRTPSRTQPRRSAAASGVRLAAQEEPLPPLEPTPADDAEVPSTDQPPAPTDEPLEGEAIDEGPMLYDGSPMHDGQMYDGEMMYEGGEMVVPEGVDPLYLGGDSEFGHCTVCGDGVCGGSGCAGGCGFGSRPIFSVRGEYLLWSFDGMNVPPLVIQSEDSFDAGPGEDDMIIFGGNDNVLDGTRNGFRVTLGYWLDDYGKLGIGGDYLGFEDETLTFVAGDGPTGVLNAPPFIGRPFISTFPFDHDDDGGAVTPDIPPGPTIQDVDTDLFSGDVTVVVESQFQSAGLWIRRNLCCVAGCTTDCGDCVSCGSGVGGCDSCGGAEPACPMCPVLGTAVGKFFGGGTRHVDMIYGFRWAQLDERISITEDLLGLDASDFPGTAFNLNDTFDTSNEFLGGEIGFIVDWERRRWSLELLSKLALGNTRQRARLSGLTTISDDAGSPYENTGLLVQPSNAGSYQQDQFSVIPQLGLTGGFMATERLRLTLGYTLLYWTRVARPGDLIDINVDPRQIAPPLAGAENAVHPRFGFRDTDIWAQGLNAGIDYRW